ncbi:MAG TPA: S8/S53 family peptidase [Kineosporiaceae bacterium]|nr:S8/S53 family peptidase [Kineosporiaceae bacterium]
MDGVFDAQYRTVKDGLGGRGVPIDVSHTPAGQVDYVHGSSTLLALDSGDTLARIGRLLPGIRPRDAVTPESALVVLDLDTLDDGPLSVPEALELLESRLGAGEADARRAQGLPLASPDHLLHITRLCPAVEPEVPPGREPAAWPAPRPPQADPRRRPRVGICDTGLLPDLDLGLTPWLAGVTGDPDPLPQPLPNGRRRIPHFAGHGTFIAGVVRCLAADADVTVTDHFSTSGAELESVMTAKLDALAATGQDVICLSAGTYTRGDWASLGFADLHRRYPRLTLVTAAGNDGSSRPFYPAAFDWVVGVGALGADQRNRAWFSNFGTWVDVFTVGEGLVNAYATGEYLYTEPPRRPARQTFGGLARWSGTSFAVPVVAGLIADRMARTGEDSAQATAALLEQARAAAVEGVGPALTLDEA